MKSRGTLSLPFGWEVKALVDDDGHLNVFVSNAEAPVQGLDADLSDTDTWGERFTTTYIENKYSEFGGHQYFASVNIDTDMDATLIFENQAYDWGFQKILHAETMEELREKILSIKCEPGGKAAAFIEEKIQEFVEENRDNDLTVFNLSGNQTIDIFITQTSE